MRRLSHFRPAAMTRCCQGPVPNSCKCKLERKCCFFLFPVLFQFFSWLLLTLSPPLSLIHTCFHSLADFDLFSLSASSPHLDLSGSLSLPPHAYVGMHSLCFHLFVSPVHLRQDALSQAVRHENGPLLGVVEPIPWSVYGPKPDAVFGSLLSLTPTVILAP